MRPDDPFTAVEISTAPGWDESGSRVDRWAVVLKTAYGTSRVFTTPHLEIAVSEAHGHMSRIEKRRKVAA
ncbi:hypothetical protein [Capillimicrobium parvum]|uniref:Uncharacterized protein n=1 Tax=Capillimicrobium parvum TaxID=2884022 RepID=A0A9E6XXL9_9ACTN|nr:hypothetical protein [Capillimicrobium parvum]UGS36100.1 hypothetical protein DSM104329_02498 [Capillimicrobium parvum]